MRPARVEEEDGRKRGGDGEGVKDAAETDGNATMAKEEEEEEYEARRRQERRNDGKNATTDDDNDDDKVEYMTWKFLSTQNRFQSRAFERTLSLILSFSTISGFFVYFFILNKIITTNK